MGYRILAINPGSISTKVGVYDDEKELLNTTLRHSCEELQGFKTIISQYDFRISIIKQCITKNNIALASIDAFVGRGGVLHPIPSGTYEVNNDMIEDLKEAKYGEHASNLGAIIALTFAREMNKKAYIVDPVVVDEMVPEARISGHPLFARKSLLHALNQKAMGREAAKTLKKEYKNCNLIVAHMGGGISIGAHKNGQIVDVNNALDGYGPFSPERSGTLPSGQLAKLCFSGNYTYSQIKRIINGEGGLSAHLKTNDSKEIAERIKNGDKEALIVYKAMAYQIAKEITSLFPIFEGKVDAVVLTGGLAYDKEYLIPWIRNYIQSMVKILVFPGEEENLALVNGVLRVLQNEEKCKIYTK